MLALALLSRFRRTVVTISDWLEALLRPAERARGRRRAGSPFTPRPGRAPSVLAFDGSAVRSSRRRMPESPLLPAGNARGRRSARESVAPRFAGAPALAADVPTGVGDRDEAVRPRGLALKRARRPCRRTATRACACWAGAIGNANRRALRRLRAPLEAPAQRRSLAVLAVGEAVSGRRHPRARRTGAHPASLRPAPARRRRIARDTIGSSRCSAAARATTGHNARHDAPRYPTSARAVRRTGSAAIPGSVGRRGRPAGEAMRYSLLAAASDPPCCARDGARDRAPTQRPSCVAAAIELTTPTR